MDFLREMYRSSRERAEKLPAFSGFPLPVRSLKDALKDMAIIAEVKYATPKDGLLGIMHGPAFLAQTYERKGARAISCLTEPDYFAGSLEYIGIIRSHCNLPILMKDFITDKRQIAAGRAMGADAILLITEMLSIRELAELHGYGCELGMDCLVEVHTREGLGRALEIGAAIIGANVRDLVTLMVDPKRHEELVAHIPAGIVKVAESGITSGARLMELKAMGYDAALIGRALADEKQVQELFHVG
jgi:indole-3-glycerol phosphate synthase